MLYLELHKLDENSVQKYHHIRLFISCAVSRQKVNWILYVAQWKAGSKKNDNSFPDDVAGTDVQLIWNEVTETSAIAI